MNTILNLDEYKKNIDLTLEGKVYNIPPITYKLRNELIEKSEAIGKSQDKKINLVADLELILPYLNSNLNNIIFTVEELMDIMTPAQAKATSDFILVQLGVIEKN